jgi:RNA polymerase sigma factor (sigma-70 family)
LEEAKLAERAREGDTAAYERLVHAHQAVAFRAAYLATGDAPEAEDATQEAFIKVYRALDRFRPGAPFRPWLLAIVTNEARNRHSAGRRAKLNLQVAAEDRVVRAPVNPVWRPEGQQRNPTAAVRKGAMNRERRWLRGPREHPQPTSKKGPRLALPHRSRPYRRGPPLERSFGSAATTSPPAATVSPPRTMSGSSSGKTERPGSSRPSTPTVI